MLTNTELILNLHMHTTYSDGSGSHRDIANAALKTGLDAVIVTDHNVWVSGVEGYYKQGKRRVLLLTGEEVHNQAQIPQRNHLLVFNANRELAPLAADTQNLIDNARRDGGLCFLAHPYDPECPPAHEQAIHWENWQVQGYTGLELWNGLSELKVRGTNIWRLLFFAFFPRFLALHPPAPTLSKWDELLNDGKKVVAVGGSDAHALHLHAGPLKRTIYPYAFHFAAINTHLLVEHPFTGDVEADKTALYAALAAGHCFVGYDLPASTCGFRFTAQGRETEAQMGDEIPAEGGVTLKARLPLPAECRLFKNGKLLHWWKERETCTFNTTEPGVYRVEVWRRHLGQRRGWIFSNPIYVR